MDRLKDGDGIFRLRGVTSKSNPFSFSNSSARRLSEKLDPSDGRNAALINEFSRRRAAANTKKLSNFSSMGGDVFAAIPRFYDPMEYWEFSQLPWDIQKDEHRFRLYKWLDLFYRTHYLIPILVDIFTRFPLVGMELHSKDDQLVSFYEDAFFDRLDYEQFLVDLGREYWTYGESFPLGSFNESLGVWEREELQDPTLIMVENVPILGTTQYRMKPPPALVRIVKDKRPKELYYRLQQEYPELIPYLIHEQPIPISDVLLKQVAFKVSPRDTHGTPILLRALRTLMHEEKLLASQDAIAERLYSPLILAKLGVQDLGDGQGPWIPGQDELAAFRDDLDMALASDFRLIVHHFGVEIQNVFGREQMPRLGDDFDRIERRVMQVFGVNPSLLSGGGNGQPYASSALQAEFLNQILRTYQGYLKKHFKQRAMIVAEAQEHYDYEKRGDTRIPIMEEVVEINDEGFPEVVKKHKLLIPELRMKVLDLRDEATQRNFLQQLRAEGVAIPDSELAMGMNFDFDESLDTYQEETIKKTVAQQEAKVKAYKILTARGLPIPPDLRAEVEGAQAQDPNAAGGAPTMGGPPGMGGGDMMMPPPPGGGGMPDLGTPEGSPPPAAPMTGGPPGNAPDISTERTPLTSPGSPAGMSAPKSPGKITSNKSNLIEEGDSFTKKLPRKKANHDIIPKKVNEDLDPEEIKENPST